MIRIGWLSPLTPKSGVGTFTHALSQHFPAEFEGEEIDLTLIFTPDDVIYPSEKRTIQAQSWDGFENILGLFDIVFYNIGNNSEHHQEIFRLARRVPGVIIFHDYVYQHYLADQCVNRVQSTSSFGAMLLKFGPPSALSTLRNSRITSRLERPIYSPWDTDYASQVPLSSPFAKMGSAAIVHSQYAEREVRRHLSGPLLRLGMPYDQKATLAPQQVELWAERVAGATQFKALFFGHINPTKSLDLILEAIADSEYLRGRLQLTIAGFASAPDHVEQLKSLIAMHRLDSVVTFELNVSDTRLRDLSNATDLFINLRFPNTEGASVSLVEQMAAGKPVLIYDTGCYAEVPDDAALKVGILGSADAIRARLEESLVNPAGLISIGRKAREHVARLSCEEYVRRLLAFVTEHREQLQHRTKFGSIQRVAAPKDTQKVKPEDVEWLRSVAEARLSFDLLDKGLAPVDPSLIFGFTAEDLAEYVAVAILGAPTQTRLIGALAKHISSRPRDQVYWDIDYLRLLAAAIFDGSPKAVERLSQLAPSDRMDLWDILSKLPPRAFHPAVALMLIGRPLDAEAAAEVERDVAAGKPLPLLLAARSGTLPIARKKGSSFDDLDWLRSVPIHLDMPLEWSGSNGLIDMNDPGQAMLIGTYPHEPSLLVWTRGRVSFLILNAGPRDRVDIAFRSVIAGIGPRKVRIHELGQAHVFELVVADEEVHLACVELARRRPTKEAAGPSIIAIQVDHSFRPCDVGWGNDARDLGICLQSVSITPAAVGNVELLEFAASA